MFELPSGLGVIQCRGVARKLELFHHLLRPSVFSFKQEGEIDVEFDQLPGLVLVTSWRGTCTEESFETIARFRVFFFLERNSSEIVLRLRHFGIEFSRLPESSLGSVEIFLGEEDFPT